MNFIQIASSVERGAYYYDPVNDIAYHVPYEELLELNNVQFKRLFGLLVCSAIVVAAIIVFINGIQHEQNISLPLWLLTIVAVLSSCMLCQFVRCHQKKISDTIQSRYSILSEGINLAQEIKQGGKVYFKILAYIAFLFCMAILSLNLLKDSPDILLEIFFVAFFDTGAMMITILQPFGKIRAYSKIKKGECHHG